MTIHEVRERVEAIRVLNDESLERSHEDWDALYRDVLSAIACRQVDSLSQAADLARQALLLEEMDLGRWYA